MKILVIDDDPAITELLKILLAPTTYDVFTANSGAVGVGIVKSEMPDVVILNLMMPELDGWQVCKLIREFSDVPIIILSALANPDMVARALDSGADDYLIKPVPIGTLIAHINNLIRRSQTNHPFMLNIEQPATSGLI
jgi:two-component system KDP operon response regulator KdpE